MAYKHYTRCYSYPAGGKPYNEDDRPAFLIGQLLKMLVITGVSAGVGFLLGGPVGAIVAAVVAYFGSVTAAIDKAADEWLNHRLICLDADNPKCAVGIVAYNPFVDDLGAFDNDQFFDVVLMPHPTADVYNDEIKAMGLSPANRYNDNGTIVSPYDNKVGARPENDILGDNFQGQTLLKPRPDLETDLGYAKLSYHARSSLHCEAEGDFWVKMKQWAPAITLLLTAALVVTVAGTAAGAAGGAALGCAIGGIFGPLGCLIGGIIGAIAGALAGGAAAGALSYYGGIKPVLQALFDANPGNVEDANVGDKALGPIRMGDHVAVLGEHVYDGYHKGWHEFHPLMAVIKFDRADGNEAEHYLKWQPDFLDTGTVPARPPNEVIDLTAQDMRDGLASANFTTRCKHLRDAWCGMLHEAFDPATRTKQQSLDHRWTIHPTVDGCLHTTTAPSIIH